MRFSIIVVCYNAGDKLNATLDSILSQTYIDYEVIVKDGLSTDGSTSKIAKDNKITLYGKVDTGIYDAMNQAIEISKGDCLIFLNCGDFFYNTDTLKNINHIIENNPTKGIYYGDMYHESKGSRETMPKEINAFTCYRHMPCHQAIIYDRNMFSERKYDINYKIRADYEHFLWAFFVKKINPYYLDMPIAKYEGDGFSEKKENIKLDQEEHRKITEQYIPKTQLIKYKSIMLLTLAPLRSKIANSKKTAKMYDGIRSKIYK